MKKTKIISLKLWLPILFLGLFGGLIGIMTWQTYMIEKASLFNTNTDALKREMDLLQDEIERQYTNQSSQILDSLFSTKAELLRYDLLVLIDKKHNIVVSSNPQQKALHALSIENIELSEIEHSRKLNLDSVRVLSDEGQLLAYYPVKIKTNNEIKNNKSLEMVLFAKYSLTNYKAHIWQEVSRSIVPLSLTLLLAMASLIYFINRFILLPIKLIRETARSFSDNLESNKIPLYGNGEFGQLAKEFDQMVESRKLYENDLKHSHAQTEKALKEIEQQKYALDQHSIVAITNIEGTIQYVNDKFCNSTGYAKHELIGKDHRILNSGYHPRAFFKEMYATISKGFVWQSEICNLSKRGDLFWLETTIIPFLSEDGQPQSYVAIRTDITKRKITQENLLKSEQRFNLAMSVANDGIWDWIVTSSQVIFDSRFYTMAGYQPDEFPSDIEELKKRMHPADRVSAIHNLNQYVNQKSTEFSSEFRLQTKNGNYIWILSKGEFVEFDASGQPLRMIGTHRDITETKNALSALRKSETNLLLAQNSAHIGHYSYDIINDQWSCSKELENILGIKSNFAKNFENWKNLIDVKDRNNVVKYLNNSVFEGREDFDYEYRIRNNSTGELRWVHGLGRLKLDNNDIPNELFGTIQDITQRKETELALQIAKDKQTLLVNTIPYGIQESDLNGMAVFANDIFYKLLETKPENVIGHNFWELLHNTDSSSKLKFDFKEIVKKQPKPSAFYAKRVTPSGENKILEVTWDYQRDHNGKLLGFIAVLSDITQQRQSEKALQRKQKMEAIGQLTGGIAHDFNNILGIIIGNLDMLEVQFEGNDKATKRLDSACRAAFRARDLTQKLLGYSRDKPKKEQVVDLNQLIHGIDDVISLAINPQVFLSFNLESDLWLTKIDIDEFQDALINLLINAKDSISSTGTISITTSNFISSSNKSSAPSTAEQNKYVSITIADSGSGIPKELQPKVFEPFFTTKEQGKGTGLGLAMVSGFVKRSGGFIELKSTENKGTSITLLLPKSEATPVEKVQLDVKKTISKVRKNTETILIVEDEFELIILTKATLESMGFSILTATNPSEALKVLDQNKSIDLVFSDIVMPGKLSGFQLADEINNHYPHIRILLTSGFEKRPGTTLTDSSTNYELLRKPYTLNEMSSTIIKLLSTSKAT